MQETGGSRNVQLEKFVLKLSDVVTFRVFDSMFNGFACEIDVRCICTTWYSMDLHVRVQCVLICLHQAGCRKIVDFSQKFCKMRHLEHTYNLLMDMKFLQKL